MLVDSLKWLYPLGSVCLCLFLCVSFSLSWLVSLSLAWLVVDSLKWFNPPGSVSGSATIPAGRFSPSPFKASNGFVRANSNRFPNKVQTDLWAHMLENLLEKPATTFEGIKQRHFNPNPRLKRETCNTVL